MATQDKTIAPAQDSTGIRALKGRALTDFDPDIAAALRKEIERQQSGIELIASENFVSQAVLEANGSVFTNKYAEGFPGKRYYGGQENTDRIESLAIERAKALFRCDDANVQALSGAAANIAIYFAWLNPGDAVLGMDLTHGGHLTHGAPVTKIADIFKFHRYRMADVETGAIDYDQLRQLALEHHPRLIIAGFSAYPRELDYAAISAIAREVGAVAMADISHIGGFVAAGVLKNPFDYGFNVVMTTTHKSLGGPRGALILSKGKPGNPLKAPEKTIENLPTLINRSVFPGLQGGPHMNVIAGIAVMLKEVATPEFKAYASQALKNAKHLAQVLMDRGCKLVTNGTDNHLMVVDCVKSFGIDGKEVEGILGKVHVTASKSTIPDEPRSPFSPSGLRLGTPAMTTRGMTEREMELLAGYMLEAIEKRADESALARISEEVRQLAQAFPLPATGM